MKVTDRVHARKKENCTAPRGESQHQPRQRDATATAFLAASEGQLYQPGDGRKYAVLGWQKRQVLRAMILAPHGLSSTAAEISAWTRIPKRTVERILRRLKRQGYYSNVRVLAVRDRYGRRVFKRERMLRALDSSRLIPANLVATIVPQRRALDRVQIKAGYSAVSGPVSGTNVAVSVCESGGETSSQDKEPRKTPDTPDTPRPPRRPCGAPRKTVKLKAATEPGRPPATDGSEVALRAFEVLRKDETDDSTAAMTVMWIMYRALAAGGRANVPRTIAYYLKAVRNLEVQYCDHPGGLDPVIETAEGKLSEMGWRLGRGWWANQLIKELNHRLEMLNNPGPCPSESSSVRAGNLMTAQSPAAWSGASAAPTEWCTHDSHPLAAARLRLDQGAAAGRQC